jgi:hypothetical protein
MMKFNRRPQLSGKNLVRQRFGVLRGNIRRKDPDSSSPVPYFPGLAPGQTLELSTQAGATTATFLDNSFLGTLTSLNTALGSGGRAFDAGGTIGLRSNALGAESFIEVTGGTAAPFLGFTPDTTRVFSMGGELASSPEGEIGNPWGSAMPGRGEDLNFESLQRITGRLSGNLDVLYADLQRTDAAFRKVGILTGGNIAGNADYGTASPPAGAVLCTGLGALSAASSREDLAAFFLIVDTATRQPAQSAVVGVVKGSPPGPPPYTNTAGWTANDGGNVLGLDLVKLQAPITAIQGGRTVTCTGTSFLSTVVEGDLAEIVGATNTDPWSHNGYRWVVEKILDGKRLMLRPMSLAELQMVGANPSEEQPILELNDTITGSQVFGQLRIRTGSFAPNLQLVVTPPLPAGGSYELWAAAPARLRTTHPTADQAGQGPLSRGWVSTSTPSPDLPLSGFTPAISGSGDLTLPECYYRWHGRVYRLPAQTFQNSFFTNNATTFLVFDSTKGRVVLSNLASEVFGPTPIGFYICTVRKQAGVLSVKSAERPAPFTAPSAFSVGTRGDFTSLADAAGYLNNLVTLTGARSIPSFELVLLNDLTLAAPVVFNVPGLRIRGASPDVCLVSAVPAGSPLLRLTSTSGVISLEGLRVQGTGADYLVELTGTGAMAQVSQVRSAGAPLLALLRTTQTADFVGIERSGLTLAGGVVWGPSRDIVFENSNFTHSPVAGRTAVQILCDASDGPVGTPGYLRKARLSGCQFWGWQTDQNRTNPLLLNDTGEGKIHIEDCTFEFGVGLSTTACLLRSTTALVTLENSRVGTSTHGIHTVIESENRDSAVLDSTLYVLAGRDYAGVKCGRVLNSSILAGTGSYNNRSVHARILHPAPQTAQGLTLLFEAGEFGTIANALRRAQTRKYRDTFGTLWITHNARLDLSTNNWVADDESQPAVAVRFGIDFNGRYIAAYPGSGTQLDMNALLSTYEPFITSGQSVTWKEKHKFEKGLDANGKAITNIITLEPAEATNYGFQGANVNFVLQKVSAEALIRFQAIDEESIARLHEDAHLQSEIDSVKGQTNASLSLDADNWANGNPPVSCVRDGIGVVRVRGEVVLLSPSYGSILRTPVGFRPGADVFVRGVVLDNTGGVLLNVAVAVVIDQMGYINVIGDTLPVSSRLRLDFPSFKAAVI